MQRNKPYFRDHFRDVKLFLCVAAYPFDPPSVPRFPPRSPLDSRSWRRQHFRTGHADLMHH
ncbi:MAG: hypothetical protein ACTHKB_01640, partial [Burkholderiaceae bacterium]